MWFKSLPGEAVEGERGHSTLETRGGYGERAVGAAPTGEVVVFDPDQSLVPVIVVGTIRRVETNVNYVFSSVASSVQ